MKQYLLIPHNHEKDGLSKQGKFNALYFFTILFLFISFSFYVVHTQNQIKDLKRDISKQDFSRKIEYKAVNERITNTQIQQSYIMREIGISGVSN